ncbi:MAG: isoprenylcysteine carboxylmethyltransferase family protein [Deltaproteobacteria bacterium]|nr:isoprenylcysteine carboxylmethyltransferase family protein [Deltaproteobacteria bacterium]
MIEKLRIRLTQLFVIILMVTIAVSSSAWEIKAPLFSTILFLVGAILVGIASLGRLWCSLYIAGYKTDNLVTEGPYSMSRNPLYFFSLLGALGVGFASETLLAPVIILSAFTIYYPLVIKSEEAELQRLHPEKFYTYFENVPKFFPSLSKLKEPEKYIVKPVIFKKHMFEALWFIWIVGLLEIIEELHELDVLPTMFKIY